MRSEIITGDVTEVLAGMAAKSVHLCITSPPYWGLRQYLVDNAVCLRHDLTEDEVAFVTKELEKHGVKPKL